MGADAAMVRGFAERYGAGAEPRAAWAPGRVNLIGEHTDYNGLPVFPMAIQRGIALVYRARDDGRARIANVDSRYPETTFPLEAAIPADPAGAWANYAKAAGQAVAGLVGAPRGMDALLASDLPASAGLSSSSALVVATALALLDVNRRAVPPLELMDLLARAERYVGLQGGGMDQAISLGGRDRHAVRIDFDPLRLQPVRVPADWRFVVASSLVVAEKSGAARDHYNARAAQCRRGLEAAWRSLGLDGPVGSYRDLLGSAPAEALAAAAARLPHPEGARFRHVVTEAGRVEAAVAAMTAGDLPGFGRLMSASHASLRDDFEVSCEPLDRLVALAEEGGACGARLTGAGFGGCIVALCAAADVERVCSALAQGFYRDRGGAGPEVLFVAEPSAGASVGPAPSR